LCAVLVAHFTLATTIRTAIAVEYPLPPGCLLEPLASPALERRRHHASVCYALSRIVSVLLNRGGMRAHGHT
jgi:hypothetical protein